MECPNCGSENRPEAAFCMACGSPLPGAPFTQVERGKPSREPAPPGTRKGTREEGGSATGGTAEGIPVGPQARGEAGAGEGAWKGVEEKGQLVPGRPAPPLSSAGDEKDAGGAAPAAEMVAPVHGREAGGAAPGKEEKPSPEKDSRVVSPGGFVFGGYAPPGADIPPAAPAPPRAPAVPDSPTVAIPLSEEGGRKAREATATPQVVSAGRTPSVEAGAEPPAHGVEPVSGAGTGAAGAPGETLYYLPPEVDYGAHQAPPPAPPAASPEAVDHAAAEPEKTQAIGPVKRTGASRGNRVICPECYASNAETNSFCQECGSPLPLASLRQPASARPRVLQAAPQRTMALPTQEEAAFPPGAPGGEIYAPEARGERSRGEKSFGAADVLAVGAAVVLAASLLLPLFLEGFSYKKGLDIGMFSHQGAYIRGRVDLLGGPGLLPYGGMEFLTVGLITALGLGLALLFLVLRVGRGPMFLLAGCLLLLPIFYILFQAILPLRQMGVEIQPAAGLARVFSGSGETPGLGPPVWMISAAALLLVLAGFLAPPRGWGRLFSCVVFLGLVAGAAFFCAACYNWNIFISGAAGESRDGAALVVSLIYTFA